MHAVEKYARSVVDGKQLAGRMVRLACERHLRDLTTGHERGLRFDETKATRILKFFGCLRLPDRDEPFVLTPFWQFIVGSIFGWLGPDGYRRFRTAYIEVGKGAGKTPIAAGVGLYGLMADGERAAEVYPAATNRDQAAICFRDCKHIAEASPTLRNLLDIQTHNIAHIPTGSFLRPVSSEHRGLDGKRVHIALIDEVHEHPNSMVVDKIRAGTKGRKQALIFMITNSGYDKESVCWRQREYAEKVLEGVRDDDTLFAYVCQLDPCDKCFAEGARVPSDTCNECDDWRNEKVWEKVNPNIGVSISARYLKEQVNEAVGMPAKESMVKRLNFCIWTMGGLKGAIPMDKWRACAAPQDLDFLRTLVAQGGLDLGLQSDFSAFVLVFAVDSKLILRPYFWIPEECLNDKRNTMREQYRLWYKAGFIRVTSGNTVDYDIVRRDICELAGTEPATSGFSASDVSSILPQGSRGSFDNHPLDGPFRIKKIRIDRVFQGAQIATQLLGDGFEVESFGQGFLSMTAPTKEFLESIRNGEIEHGDNPVLNWMASNLAVEVGPAGLKPTKQESSGKIDGIVAAIMGISGAITDRTEYYVPGSMLDRELMNA